MRIIKAIKNNKIFHSLRTQLIIYYLLVSFIVMSIGAYFSYFYIMDILKENNERYLLQQFRQTDYNIQNVINEVDRVCGLFLVNEDVQQFIQENYNTGEYNEVELQNSIFNRISSFAFNYSYINSIYLYTENKGGIGGNERYSKTIRSNDINRSACYTWLKNILTESFQKINIKSGVKESFFIPDQKDAGINLISMGRRVKPIYETTKNAALILNIDERYIASIYSGPNNIKDEYIYIMDEIGNVVSSGDGKEIGIVGQALPQIDKTKDYGSFTISSRSIPIQGVYYKLKSMDCYLVGEVPLKFFTYDIVILQKVLVIVFISSIIVIFIASFFWLKKVTKPLNILAGKMSDMSRGELGLTFPRIPENEFGIVIRRFNEMSLSIVELIRKNEEIQVEKREHEIEALQSQINPHFLYNTLNMIKWMAAVIKARNISDSIIDLGNILRPAFKSMDILCTLKEEIEYLESYIKIINRRFSNNVSFQFHIDESFLNCRIPRFILQPIIENSITHGMRAQENNFKIETHVFNSGDELKIVISDTGKGIAMERLEEINQNLANMQKKIEKSNGGTVGIYNVNRRIRLNFGNNYGLSLESTEGQATKTTISIPVIL